MRGMGFGTCASNEFSWFMCAGRHDLDIKAFPSIYICAGTLTYKKKINFFLVEERAVCESLCSLRETL